MKDAPVRIVLMMTVENIHGREVLSSLLNFKFPVLAVIVEHKSKLAENARNYLKNDFYNPRSFHEIVDNQPTKVHYVENHNDDQTLSLLKKYEPDYIILGNARILKEHIIKTAKFGVLNAHPALLPRYQGLDCVGWSILNGDQVGASIHFIDAGVDSGPIILQEVIDYSDCTSLLQVRIKVMRKCAELIIKSLIGLEFGSLKPIAQDLTLAKRYPALPAEKLEQLEQFLSKSK